MTMENGLSKTVFETQEIGKENKADLDKIENDMKQAATM